jgi:ATP adenylyltransferase
MLRPGTLWAKTIETTAEALRSGVLRPIHTENEIVSDGGVDFLVRKVSSLMRKQEAKKKPNPFLPYEEGMFVADISPTHLCLLNKFNVIAHHLLIVTRHFEDQDMLLTRGDFEALCLCMGEFDGLAFYNGGEVAGASERHKHMQMIPLPMARTGPGVPIESVFAHTGFANRPGRVSGLPFTHAFARIDNRSGDPAQSAHGLYREMLDSVGLNRTDIRGDVAQSGPYNLLFTTRWMLLVPRAVECFASISINALGFAGALLAKNDRQMGVLKARGPMAVLKHTAMKEMMG